MSQTMMHFVLKTEHVVSFSTSLCLNKVW